MKKLVILMLVLGMVSAASAALTPILTWVDGNVTYTLDIANAKVIGTGTVLGNYTGQYIQQTSGTGSLAPNATTGTLEKAGVKDAAGDLGDITDVGPGAYWLTGAGDIDAEVPPNQSLGDWFEFDVTFDGSNDFIMSYYDGAEFQTGLQGTIPEPMTIALLGLGGLFIRRKK